jgi:hypothetical protein
VVSVFDTEAFTKCFTLQGICVPASVSTIGLKCFVGAVVFSFLTFEPNSQLSYIGDFAFSDCTSLLVISIPSSVQKVTGLALPHVREFGIELDAESRYLRICNGFLMNRAGNSLIRDLDYETDIVIGQEIEQITAGCFWNRQSLRNVTFRNCPVSVLGESGFEKCSSLESIVIPRSVQKIEDLCFMDCAQLVEAQFESVSQVSVLGNSAFRNCSHLASICVPLSVSRIGLCCFYDCRDLASVSFEVGCRVSGLGRSVFRNCSSLASICIRSYVESIGDYCFADCKALVRVEFEADAKVTALGERAFYGCSSLQSICVPSSVSRIGRGSLEMCSSLESVRFKTAGDIPRLDIGIFHRCSSLTTIFAPSEKLVLTLRAYLQREGNTACGVFCE